MTHLAHMTGSKVHAHHSVGIYYAPCLYTDHQGVLMAHGATLLSCCVAASCVLVSGNIPSLLYQLFKIQLCISGAIFGSVYSFFGREK